MEILEIEIVSKEELSRANIFPRYVTFKCEKCGNVWGVNTEWSENHTLTKKDLVCRKCATEIVAEQF
jgi:hypothetical protein